MTTALVVEGLVSWAIFTISMLSAPGRNGDEFHLVACVSGTDQITKGSRIAGRRYGRDRYQILLPCSNCASSCSWETAYGFEHCPCTWIWSKPDNLDVFAAALLFLFVHTHRSSDARLWSSRLQSTQFEWCNIQDLAIAVDTPPFALIVVYFPSLRLEIILMTRVCRPRSHTCCCEYTTDSWPPGHFQNHFLSGLSYQVTLETRMPMRMIISRYQSFNAPYSVRANFVQPPTSGIEIIRWSFPFDYEVHAHTREAQLFMVNVSTRTNKHSIFHSKAAQVRCVYLSTCCWQIRLFCCRCSIENARRSRRIVYLDISLIWLY